MNNSIINNHHSNFDTGPKGCVSGCEYALECFLENSEHPFPCVACEKSTHVKGVTYACPGKLAQMLASDIGNGVHTKVVGNDEEEDLASRYFVVAQSDDSKVVACVILRVASPEFNVSPYWELHILDNLCGGYGTLEDVDEMTAEALEHHLANYIKNTSENLRCIGGTSDQKRYLVQTRDADGNISVGIYSAQAITNLHGFRDCSGCDYEVFDVQHYGKVIRLEEQCDSFGEPNYHRFCLPKELGGATVFSGFSPVH